MTDNGLAELAAALHDEWDRQLCEPSEPGVPCDECAASAAAILAALDGWELVESVALLDARLRGYREGRAEAFTEVAEEMADNRDRARKWADER